MDYISQLWAAIGTSTGLTVLSIILCIVRNSISGKSNTKDITNTVTTGLDLIQKSSDERVEKMEDLVNKQRACMTAQQKQIEEQGKQIEELTKLVTKVVDKRVD